MIEPDDDLDEVALNVLHAEGVDVPTACEASRRDCGAESPRAEASGCLGYVILLTVALLVIAFLLL